LSSIATETGVVDDNYLSRVHPDCRAMNAGKHPPGRPWVDDKVTKLATSELIAAEHVKFIKRGGSNWLKYLLGVHSHKTVPSAVGIGC
jgi:hypothetical protein